MTLPPEQQPASASVPPQPGPAPVVSAPDGLPAVPSTNPPRRHRWLWIAVAVVVVLVAAGVGSVLALRPTKEDEAVDRCQSEILARLKSPSTAKFGETKVTSNDGDFASYFKVSGQVDAQNGFGAMVRVVYHCKLQLENGGAWITTEAKLRQ